MRTVAHYIESMTFGGCEEIVYQTVTALDRSRWRAVVIHPDTPQLDELTSKLDAAGIDRRPMPLADSHARVAAFRQIVGAVRDLRPHVFHAHLNWSLGCRYGVMAAKLCGVPAVVATLHLATPIAGLRMARLKQRMQAASIDMYVGVADGVRDHIVTDLGVDRRRTRTIHNGVDLGKFTVSAPEGLRQSLGQHGERPLALTVARLHEQKGLEYLLQAAAHCPDVIFAIAGDGPQRQHLEEMRRQLGLEDRVLLLGHRSDVPQLLAACDLFVLPSLYEGLPVSVLEAMACGKPVVASDIPGTRDAVIDGTTGLLVPPTDAPALAAAIATIARDSRLAGQMGVAGRDHVCANFSVEAMARGIQALYDELLERSR